jgi:hypothetical protein
MLGASCSPCCGCRCQIRPSSIKLTTSRVAKIIDERLRYTSGPLFGTPAPNGSRLGSPDNVDDAVVLNFVTGIGSAGFGSTEVVLTQDDSIAPYNGFGYVYDGVPGVASGSSRAFTFFNFFGGPSVDVRNLTTTCISLTARVFLYSASDGPSVGTDSTAVGQRPCVRIGYYVSDTHRVSAPYDHIAFTRTALCDGLSVEQTFLEPRKDGEVNRILLPPSVCITRFLNIPVYGNSNSRYSDTTSASPLTGDTMGIWYYTIGLDSQ